MRNTQHVFIHHNTRQRLINLKCNVCPFELRNLGNFRFETVERQKPLIEESNTDRIHNCINHRNKSLIKAW